MPQRRIPLRQARAEISKILDAGETVIIGRPHENARGFIVAVPQHQRWNPALHKKALKEAKAALNAALAAES